LPQRGCQCGHENASDDRNSCQHSLLCHGRAPARIKQNTIDPRTKYRQGKSGGRKDLALKLSVAYYGSQKCAYSFRNSRWDASRSGRNLRGRTTGCTVTRAEARDHAAAANVVPASAAQIQSVIKSACAFGEHDVNNVNETEIWKIKKHTTPNDRVTPHSPSSLTLGPLAISGPPSPAQPSVESAWQLGVHTMTRSREKCTASARLCVHPVP